MIQLLEAAPNRNYRSVREYVFRVQDWQKRSVPMWQREEVQTLLRILESGGGRLK